MTTPILSRPTDKHNERRNGVLPTILIIHSIGMPCQEALRLLCVPEVEASCHYYIGQDGQIVQMVPEERRAWHAGKSLWSGVDDINSHSIGIELGWSEACEAAEDEASVPGPFTPVQMDALLELSQAICSRWPILPENVLAHSDIAPQRKRDPGERFDWAWMSSHGIGVWPDPLAFNEVEGDISEMLARYGYDVSNVTAAIKAFQRHFQPEDCSGIPNAQTFARLASLLEQVSR